MKKLMTHDSNSIQYVNNLLNLCEYTVTDEVINIILNHLDIFTIESNYTKPIDKEILDTSSMMFSIQYKKLMDIL